MAKRVPRRVNKPGLVSGEYEPSERDPAKAEGARVLFWTAARDVVPEFFERLRDDVFPEYDKLAKQYSRLELDRCQWTRPTVEFLPFLSALGQPLLSWAQVFHVDSNGWI